MQMDGALLQVHESSVQFVLPVPKNSFKGVDKMMNLQHY
jgi:hypothetical protein